MMSTVYLDYAAATPLDVGVQEYIATISQHTWANPSSTHAAGRRSKAVLERARQKCASTLGASPSSIFFVPSATAANNLVVASHSHVVTTSIEHSSIANIPGTLRVSPGAHGLVSPSSIVSAITAETSLVSVIWVHNELGTIQDLRAIIEAVESVNAARSELGQPRVFLHIDAVQAPNYFNIDMQQLPVDYLTLSSQKIYGPRGAALLFVRDAATIKPLIYGGYQEQGLWPGTQNVAACAGLAYALELAQARTQDTWRRTQALKDRATKSLEHQPLSYNTPAAQSVPCIINITVPNCNQEELITYLDLRGVCVSSGSSCNSGSTQISPVIKEIGAYQPGSAYVRVSYGRFTSPEDIDAFTSALIDLIQVNTSSAQL